MENKTSFFSDIINLLKIISFPTYIITIVFFRLPPFYILPIRSLLFTSHTIGTFLIILLFIFSIYLSFIERKIIYKNKLLLFIILFYFLTLSLSIIPAINILEFVRVYKNYLLGIILFFVSIKIIDNKQKIKTIILVLVITLSINFIFQLITYFSPVFLYSLLSKYLYVNYINAVEVQANRQRFFIEFFDGSLIPFIFYYITISKKIIIKLFLGSLIGLALFLAIISNFRIELVVSLFTILFSLFLLIKRKLLIFLLLLFIFFAYIGNVTSISISGNSSIDRLLIEDKNDVKSIETRITYWEKAVEMGLSSPLFGIGLGNYYDNYSPKRIFNYSLFDWKNQVMKMTLIHPHNVFFGALAETGFLGLLSTLLLFGYFIFSDIRSLKKANNLSVFAMISFWSLFISSLTGPRFILAYLCLFWLLRALILKLRPHS